MAKSVTRRVVCVFALAIALWVGSSERKSLVAAVATGPASVGDLLAQLETVGDQVRSRFDAPETQRLSELAERVDRWFDELASFSGLDGPDPFIRRIGRLVAIKSRVDAELDRTLAQRIRFAGEPPGPGRRTRVRSFLRATTALIDLSGRLRYRLYAAIDDVASAVASAPELTARLVDQLAEGHSRVGSVAMAGILLDPDPETDGAGGPQWVTAETKERLIELAAATGSLEMVPTLAVLATEGRTSPRLVIASAEAIGRLGLPQDPRPAREPSLPQPSITARRLHTILLALDLTGLPLELVVRHRRLVSWLRPRIDGGIPGDSYRLGRFEVHAGDWLLMRNPSPYNRFTDLAPGLFTHVGVITVEPGSDGIRRMVVVDLPELGKRMRAVTVDTFVKRTLHYVVLRHPDRAVARVMAARAREAIGQRTEFDLNFRTDRVAALRGQPLVGKKIHTYCAGLLLLAAQETGRSREAFFPLPEYPAGGHAVENLAGLGMTFGRDFISPTGAIFSPQLMIAARRDPMYEPRREIQEAVYDHFAVHLEQSRLKPAPDLLQTLRLKLAEAARTNPLLTTAMAGVAGVDRDTDLVAAARTLAVVETLDQIARGSSDEFFLAREALLAGPEAEWVREGYRGEEIAELRIYRARHAELLRQWQTDQAPYRAVRISLVRYYIGQGKRRIDARFFGGLPSGS